MAVQLSLEDVSKEKIMLYSFLNREDNSMEFDKLRKFLLNLKNFLKINKN